MKISKISKNTSIALMTVLMSHVPNVVMAEEMISSSNGMMSTGTVVMMPTGMVLANITRAQAQKEVSDYLQKTEVREALMKHGVSADEASARLASLSEQELRQLSGQVQQARAGGDILFTVLIIVLIIFLIQRI